MKGRISLESYLQVQRALFCNTFCQACILFFVLMAIQCINDHQLVLQILKLNPRTADLLLNVLGHPCYTLESLFWTAVPTTHQVVRLISMDHCISLLCLHLHRNYGELAVVITSPSKTTSLNWGTFLSFLLGFCQFPSFSGGCVAFLNASNHICHIWVAPAVFTNVPFTQAAKANSILLYEW